MLGEGFWDAGCYLLGCVVGEVLGKFEELADGGGEVVGDEV